MPINWRVFLVLFSFAATATVAVAVCYCYLPVNMAMCWQIDRQIVGKRRERDVNRANSFACRYKSRCSTYELEWREMKTIFILVINNHANSTQHTQSTRQSYSRHIEWFPLFIFSSDILVNCCVSRLSAHTNGQ